MTPRGETPSGEHRRLRLALRHARDALHLTQKDVADALDWSTSKLIRIEKGTVGISVTDLKALLLQYQITDAAEIDRFVAMARSSKKAAWWQQYRDAFPQDFLTFLGLEASTVRLKQFQGLLVPGLLQVPAYIKALIELGGATPERLRMNLDIRLKRQELLSDEGREFIFIIDESALYRQVGDAQTMRDQLLRVKEAVEQPRVTIRIMPFTAGVHKGMKSSFEILELSDEPGDYALLLDQPYKDHLYQEPNDETREFVEIFPELEKIALPASETPRRIDERLKEMEKD
jgi:transcriptional regulator with XRE-family HTH domain